MNDWMLSVVRVNEEHEHDAGDHGRHGRDRHQRQLERLKIRRQQEKHDDDASANPIAKPEEHLLHRRNLAADFDGRSLGRIAGGGDSLLDLARNAPQVFAGDIGREPDLPLHVVAIELPGHRSRSGRSATSRSSNCLSDIVLTGMTAKSCSDLVTACGISTCT